MAHIPERRKNGRKKDDEVLRKSEQKYRNILESMEEGYYEEDLAGNLTFFNNAMCRVYGYSREELMGMNYRQYTDKETAKKLRQVFNEIYKTGGTGKGYSYELIRKDGAKRYIEASASVKKDSLDRPIGFRGIIRDVTGRREAEEALEKSEEKYRTLLDHASDAILLANDEGNLLEANKKAEELLGYSRQELLGVNIAKIHPPEEMGKIIKTFREIGQNGSGTVNNTAVLTKDNKPVSVDISGSVVEYGGKKVLQGIFRDVTQRKQMEDNLRKSEERYRSILESIQEGYFELDLLGNYTFVNEANCRFLGYTKEEMVGMNSRQHMDEEAAKKIYQPYRELYRTGKPIESLEVESFRKDGTKVIYETSVSLIRDAEGKPIGYRGVSRDATERKKMEESLRQSEEKYRTVLEDIEEGYFEIDLAGNATFFNDSICRLFGYPREKFMHMNYKQYMDKENGEKCFQIYNKIYKTGKSDKVYDYEITRKDGTKRHIESSVSLQKDSSGKPIGFRGVSRDITERKRAEEALKRHQEELIQKNKDIGESRRNVQLTLERLGKAYEELKASQSKILQQEKMASIGQLAAGVAHEINNPMAFIASNLGTLNKYIRRLIDFIQTQSEMIKSLKDEDAVKKLKKKRKELKLDYVIEDVKGLITESLDGSERVQKIVLGLSRFSRVDEEEYKDVDINECIENAVNIVWNELKFKSTLKKDYGKLPHTKCYPQQMNQVFINLLINAVNSIEKQGTITIKTWNKGRSIWMAISDTGCGIPQESLSKIFEPFFTTKDVGKGTGLGLSITYEIVQRHKGDITVKSEVGKGTTFTIRVPVV